MIDDYAALISDAAAKFRLPPDYLRAEILKESGGDPLAIGDGGNALGLMQVHRGAATDVGGNWDALHALILATDKFGAAALGLNIGAPYLAKMLTQFDGDQLIASMAYNQGPGVIGKAYRYACDVAAMKAKPNA